MAENVNSSSTNTNANHNNIISREKRAQHVYYKDDDHKEEHGTTKHKAEKDAKPEDEKEQQLSYPAFCFPASPTHFTWVKLCSADIHRLQTRRGFEGQNIYFYKNYPIQFVCLAGYIVSREEHERRTVLTIDDSSGVALEVIVLKATIKDVKDGDGNDDNGDNDGDADGGDSGGGISTTTETTTTTTTTVTSTTRVPIDISQIRIGALVKIKGTLSSYQFRTSAAPPIMHVILERFWILNDTNAEIRFWNERSRFLVDVLSEPWSLTDDEVESLRQRARDEEKRVGRERQRLKERKGRLEERERKYQRRVLRRWEAEERARERECERVNKDNKRLERRLASRREST